jgi:C-terminal processing protease CtpA/Prc
LARADPTRHMHCAPLRLFRIALLATLVPAALQPQNNSDSLRIARLTALGRLWGVVKYFHPAFLEREVLWDSATIVAIDRVRNAKSTEEYGAAVSDMLASLRDPATRVTHNRPPAAVLAGTSTAGRHWEVVGPDSTLVIGLPNLNDYSASMQSLDRALPDLRRASSIVFDLRGAEPDEIGNSSFIFADSVNAYLPASSVAAPSQRRRMHSGFVPQEGSTSGGYWSGTYEQAGEVIDVTTPNRPRRIIFLTNPGSDIPPVAFALRGNGQGAIVVDGSTAQLAAGAATYRVALSEGLEAVVRVGEMNGTADTAVMRDASGDVPLRVALALARHPVTPPPAASPRPTYVSAPESPYTSAKYPGTAYRVLAAYRWWNAIYYFYPYKHLIGEDWSATLPRSIRLLEAARDSLEYAQAAAEMVTHIHDSHGGISGSAALHNFFGSVPVAVQLQYIGGQPVVISIADDSATKASGIAVGDVILKVDGEDVGARRARRARYSAYSTPQSLDSKTAARLLWGIDSTPARVTVRDRNDRVRELSLPRRAALATLIEYPRAGPIMKMLPGNIGYADLSLLSVAMVDSMFEMFRHTKAIILDDRGYPQGTAWSIAPRLTDKETVPAAAFQRPIVMSPDSSEWTTYSFVQFTPTTTKWRYHGKTVLLVDERTGSQAEHTGLFFEAANKTIIVGSPTVGANGDVTTVVLPGGLYAHFSGHDVRHVDGRQLQRVGLQPDVVVRPTLAGIRAGRDEVLERAVEILKK